MYKISDAARRAALTVKTVRYYADIGLVKPAGRSAAGYRLYEEADIAKLGFIGRARRYSFSIEQCRDLLSLYEDDQRPSAEVKRITLEKIDEIDSKLGELQELRDELRVASLRSNVQRRMASPRRDVNIRAVLDEGG